MDWNTVSTARTIRNFPLYCKTLLHSEAFTELHVYSCKRMYIAFIYKQLIFSINDRCIRKYLFNFLLFMNYQDLTIIQNRKLRNTTTHMTYPVRITVKQSRSDVHSFKKKFTHSVTLLFSWKKQVTVIIGSMHRLLYILSPTNNMKNMHVNDFRKKLRQPHTFNHF
jgi:hypothetical protein